MAPNEIAQNGWTAVPIDAGAIFKHGGYNNKPTPIRVADIQFPSQDKVVTQVQEYAKSRLNEKTYSHSMRVFYFCMAIIKDQFPEHLATFSPSILAVTSLLHDLGTAPENLSATNMSFDLYGGIKALGVLQEFGSTKDQAEAASEAIIRHQDLGTDGTISFLGQVIQLATIYDNAGEHPYMKNIGELLHDETREDVIREFPRKGWLGCFADTIREEMRLKPWCHSTHIPDFANKIESNPLMKRYE